VCGTSLPSHTVRFRFSAKADVKSLNWLNNAGLLAYLLDVKRSRKWKKDSVCKTETETEEEEVKRFKKIKIIIYS
jgi:hypothetical protein